MKIFISYARENGETAARLAAALAGMDHDVFYDKETLAQSAKSFHTEILDWIRRCDLFVFLVSPHSGGEGFTINELDEAQRKWPNLNDGVMAFQIEETDLSGIDPRLSEAVNIQTPRGDSIAYMAHAIAHREQSSRARWRPWLAGRRRHLAATVVILGLIAATLAVILPRGDDGDSPTSSATTARQASSTISTSTATAPPTTTITTEECTRRIEEARNALAGATQVTIEADADCRLRINAVFGTEGDLAVGRAVAEDLGLDPGQLDFSVDPDPDDPDDPAPELADVGPVRFAVGADELSDEARSRLDGVASYLDRNPDIDLAIHGHADGSGSASANLRLSQRRAETARRYLVDDRGVASERVSAIGFGEARPIAENSTDDGRRANRRVDFVEGSASLHVVRSGDSLWSIAAVEYGDGNRWPELHQANRALLGDPGQLIVGTKLVIPPSP